MGKSAKQFADRIDRAVRRYVRDGDVDPHVAELLLNQRAHAIREQEGSPACSVTDLEDEYDFL